MPEHMDFSRDTIRPINKCINLYPVWNNTVWTHRIGTAGTLKRIQGASKYSLWWARAVCTSGLCMEWFRAWGLSLTFWEPPRGHPPSPVPWCAGVPAYLCLTCWASWRLALRAPPLWRTFPPWWINKSSLGLLWVSTGWLGVLWLKNSSRKSGKAEI